MAGGPHGLESSLEPSELADVGARAQDNIRALLSTMHQVLWENSGWKQPGLTDMVEPAKVQRPAHAQRACSPVFFHRAPAQGCRPLDRLSDRFVARR